MSLSNNHDDTDGSNSVIQVFYLLLLIFFQDKFFQIQSLSVIFWHVYYKANFEMLFVYLSVGVHSQRFLDEN